MVTVVHSKDFDVPRIYPTSQSSKNFQLKGFPTFYSNENEYILPVNLWLNYLQNIRSVSDISCPVRAIKRYWQFLEDTGCVWNAFPPTDYLKPTYRFRNDDLLKAAKKGEIAYSTASLYMLHVIKFYEWTAHERIDPNRKISVKAVEEEAGLGDGSAYYYKDIVSTIKETAINNPPRARNQNLYEEKIANLRERLANEKRLKEKYYKQAEDYKEQLSEMASQHNQLALMIQQYQYQYQYQYQIAALESLSVQDINEK